MDLRNMGTGDYSSLTLLTSPKPLFQLKTAKKKAFTPSSVTSLYVKTPLPQTIRMVASGANTYNY